MKAKPTLILGLLLVVALPFILVGCGGGCSGIDRGATISTTTTTISTTTTTTTSTTTTTDPGAFRLTSSSLSGGSFPHIKYAYDASVGGGESQGAGAANLSVQLSWANVPAGTQSLLLTMTDDTISTAGNSAYHWLIKNIASTETTIAEGASSTSNNLGLPSGGIELRTNMSEVDGYEGPWPQDQKHTYAFRLYALNVTAVSLAVATATSTSLFNAAVTPGMIIEIVTLEAIYDGRDPNL